MTGEDRLGRYAQRAVCAEVAPFSINKWPCFQLIKTRGADEDHSICQGIFSKQNRSVSEGYSFIGGLEMSSTVIVTVEKMLETLPEEAQERVVEYLREYILELQDEIRWDALFKRAQDNLVAAARRAMEEIAAGKAELMDLERL